MSRLVLLLLVVVTCLCSCGKRQIKIDRMMERAIDTTAASRKAILSAQLDSVCNAQFDSLVQVAVDSILEKRRSEIEMIIDQ